MGRPNVFDDLITELDAVPAAAVQNVVDRFAAVAAEVAAGGGMGWIGAYLYTKPVDLTAADGVAAVTVIGAPVGLWVWSETGTKGHEVAPRHKYRGRRGYKPAMSVPDHPMTRPVWVSGMTGHRLWTKTVDRVDLEFEDLILSAIDVSVP